MSDKSPEPKAVDWKAVDAAVTVGAKVKLADLGTRADDLFDDKKAGEKLVAANAEAINTLQDRLFAERKRALLVVLQGTDTSGKDGTVRGVFKLPRWAPTSSTPSPRSSGACKASIPV